MSKLTDADVLVTLAYADSSKLKARSQLYERFGKENQGSWRWLFDRTDLQPGARVLEVGCGPGGAWLNNLDRLLEDTRVTLSDLSAGMVAEARKSLGSRGGTFSFEVLNVLDIMYGDETFDVVVANHMLYHVPDRPRAYSEIRRVLKPGGHLCASAPSSANLDKLMELVHRVKPSWGNYHGERGFNLEMGQQQLARWFDSVEIHENPGSSR